MFGKGLVKYLFCNQKFKFEKRKSQTEKKNEKNTYKIHCS